MSTTYDMAHATEAQKRAARNLSKRNDRSYMDCLREVMEAPETPTSKQVREIIASAHKVDSYFTEYRIHDGQLTAVHHLGAFAQNPISDEDGDGPYSYLTDGEVWIEKDSDGENLSIAFGLGSGYKNLLCCLDGKIESYYFPLTDKDKESLCLFTMKEVEWGIDQTDSLLHALSEEVAWPFDPDDAVSAVIASILSDEHGDTGTRRITN